MGVKCNMKYFLLIILSAFLASCSIKSQYTRYEEDKYTHTSKDTTFKYVYPNSLGTGYNGVVSPSTKHIEVQNHISEYDSVVKREYPDFIRLGVFESIGIFGGDNQNAIGGGLFGTYLDPNKIFSSSFRGDKASSFLTGGIYRFGIMEKRLRWFEDAENWTYGVSLFEGMFPDAHLENALAGFGVINFTKRWYFKKDVPYFALGARFGTGLYPSLFGKLETFAELGSIGGLNLRAYLGYAGGWNYDESFLIKSNEFATGATTPNFLYGGLGVSLLDFINIVPETYREWKYMDNSAWNIAVAEVGVNMSNAERSFFGEDTTAKSPAISGFSLKLLSSNISIPQINEHLYVGTSLLNVQAFGSKEIGIGVLPIRVGWWQVLLKDEFIVDPFIEYNYFPSSYYNIGARFTLAIPPFNNNNISVILGYTSGKTLGGVDLDNLASFDFIEDFDQFSVLYLTLQFNIQNYLFKSSDLKHNKND